jgi:hypothetical protein
VISLELNMTNRRPVLIFVCPYIGPSAKRAKELLKLERNQL